MLKSFISLKPSSSPLNSKKYSILIKKRRDLIYEGIQQIFTILDFLSLQEIYRLYLAYKRSRNRKQVQNKIIHYLIVATRKYDANQQAQFLDQLTKKSSKILLKQYSTQNYIWKQSINLDIERTNVSQLSSHRNSEKDFYKKQSAFGQNQKQSSSCFNSSSNSKHNFLSVKFNFLMFNYDDQNSKKKEIDRKKTQNSNLKAYLKVVLNAISNRNKKIGYVQGLNFWIKHMFQTKLTQEEAFTYSCFLLQKMNAQMLFKNQMIKVRQMCYVFDIYLYNNLPDLYFLLKSFQVSSIVYASNWFITLFSEQLSKAMINKIWHLFSIKGWKILIKFGISVMCIFQENIKHTSQDQIFYFLRNILENIDSQKQSKIWAIMGSIKVSNKMISYLSKQMNILYNDTEIQLWRLEKQTTQVEKTPRYSEKKPFFSCGSNQPKKSNLRQKKISYLYSDSEQKRSNGCCSPYQNQKIQTQSTQANYNFLSLCKSVNYY